jgi:hypothetical protein
MRFGYTSLTTTGLCTVTFCMKWELARVVEKVEKCSFTKRRSNCSFRTGYLEACLVGGVVGRSLLLAKPSNQIGVPILDARVYGEGQR